MEISRNALSYKWIKWFQNYNTGHFIPPENLFSYISNMIIGPVCSIATCFSNAFNLDKDNAFSIFIYFPILGTIFSVLSVMLPLDWGLDLSSLGIILWVTPIISLIMFIFVAICLLLIVGVLEIFYKVKNFLAKFDLIKKVKYVD